MLKIHMQTAKIQITNAHDQLSSKLVEQSQKKKKAIKHRFLQKKRFSKILGNGRKGHFLNTFQCNTF